MAQLVVGRFTNQDLLSHCPVNSLHRDFLWKGLVLPGTTIRSGQVIDHELDAEAPSLSTDSVSVQLLAHGAGACH